MDDGDSPASSLQIEPQDGCHPGDSVEGRVTPLPSVADENENQLDGDGPAALTGSGSTMGRATVFDQDSLNNNESCLSVCEVAPRETAEHTLCEGPKDDQSSLGQDKKTPGKRSPRAKRGTPKNIPPVGAAVPLMQTVNAELQAVGEEAAGVNANEPPKAPAPALQPLFSLIRGEVEQMDSRALPLFLHQVAETYFQEEDYEKAMKFIQLERLYHEQLLANLSAIQEQWETKWRAVQPHTVTPLRNSEKGFNGEDFEQLAKICATHQDPLLSKHKIAPVEKSLGRKCLTRPAVPEEPKERGATTKGPEIEASSAMEPSGGQHEEQPQEGSPGSHQMDWQAASPDLPVTAGKDHTEGEEEPLRSNNASLELHTPSPETARSRSGPDAAENASEEDGGSQAPPTEDHPDVAEDPKVSPPSESVTESQLFASGDTLPPVLISEIEYSQAHRKELCLPVQGAFEALPREQLQSGELAESRRPAVDGKSPQSQTDLEPGSENALCGDGEASDVSAPRPEVCMAPEEGRDKEDQVSKETEDYLHSLLEGCLKDAEESLSYEDTQDDDSDLLQDLSPEEASYSLQESLPPDESSLSLDDLAKKIEIAEAVPTEGLVSILKKRNDPVGDHPAQMQQKPAKRRVRFQEIDDNLDQDEVGSGSCILLILLCIATVFLSVGGTALYCTLGNMESPVCTDFADNMDFYYTKLLQGVAGLKHWVYLS
ncbi:consortin isoform X1 [Arvicola amphibius]|uniref:consortin isoform X1 n=1 Tax=Arvicola amphibius TaxID=1047088 RepID=UPI0018E38779|nr:consortin isoform X1 [Arvicola amphibius]XP_038205572.1 consortin isoform X1 [Arvicola amphibius]